MSTSFELTNREGLGKHVMQESLAEVSSSKGGVTAESIDDGDLFEDSEARRRNHTKHDGHDMRRMGKEQEFIVSATARRLAVSGHIANAKLENLPSAFRIEFRIRSAGHMGMPFDVCGDLSLWLSRNAYLLTAS